jgi:hypothetical protein
MGKTRKKGGKSKVGGTINDGNGMEVVTANLGVLPNQSWPFLPNSSCYICGKIEDEDLTILCDGEDCGREVHMYCLQPPLFQVPEEKWYCDLCSPFGTTRYLEQYFHEHQCFKQNFMNEISSSKVSPELRYECFYESLPAMFFTTQQKLKMDTQTSSSSSFQFEESIYTFIPPHEFDSSDPSLIGCRIDLYSTIDDQLHSGRIITVRSIPITSSTTIDQEVHPNHEDNSISMEETKKTSNLSNNNMKIEHLIQFKSGSDGRNKGLLQWLILSEHACLIFHDLYLFRITTCWTVVQQLLRSSWYRLLQVKEATTTVSTTSGSHTKVHIGLNHQGYMYYSLADEEFLSLSKDALLERFDNPQFAGRITKVNTSFTLSSLILTISVNSQDH